MAHFRTGTIFKREDNLFVVTVALGRLMDHVFDCSIGPGPLVRHSMRGKSIRIPCTVGVIAGTDCNNVILFLIDTKQRWSQQRSWPVHIHVLSLFRVKIPRFQFLVFRFFQIIKFRQMYFLHSFNHLIGHTVGRKPCHTTLVRVNTAPQCWT